jgi:hypothetical protein
MNTKNTKINSLLNEIYLLENALDKKKSTKDKRDWRTLIDSQETLLYALLKDRSAEEKILSDIVSKIGIDAKKFEEKNNIKDVASISKLNGFEKNFESIFKRDIILIKKQITELYNFYEKQKALEEPEFRDTLDLEQKKIIELKNMLDSIVNSENKISEYIKEVDKLKLSVQSNANYEYLGLKIPGNIKLLDPISKYDLVPFLKAYSAFENELRNAKINLKYLHIESDTMWSQYRKFIFHKPEDRVYIIYISSNKDNSKGGVVGLLTEDEKAGWYAHELSHFVQYSKMSNMQLLGFTIAYPYNWAISRVPFKIPFLSKWSFNYMKKLERFTDKGAIEKGMGVELAKGSNFFLNESNVSTERKKRYAEVYTPLHENMDLAVDEYIKKINSSRKKK